MIRTLTLLLPMLLWARGGLAETFEYVDPVDARSTLTIETARPSVVVGDVAEPATMCPKTHRFVCLQSQTISFAIPRNIDAATRRWEHAGRAYEFESSGNLFILGAKIGNVLRVKSVDSDKHVTYLYSSERGLLGLQVVSPAGERLFLAVRGKGFGAIPRSR
jgi:hypothetical protein